MIDLIVASLKNNIGQIQKYYIVAGLGAIFDFFLFNMIIQFTPIFYQVANIISYGVAVSFVYYIQKKWTFPSEKSHLKTIQKFIPALIMTYFISSVVLYILISMINIDPTLSKGVQIVISSILGYGINKLFVFN